MENWNGKRKAETEKLKTGNGRQIMQTVRAHAQTIIFGRMTIIILVRSISLAFEHA